MSVRFFIILALVLASFCTLVSALATDLRADYRLTWDLVENDTKLRIKLEVRTLGYIGFGFARPGVQPGMDKADIVISGIFSNGSAYLLDSHGVAGHAIPVLDAHQDYVYGDISENTTHTKVSFYRKLNTCDPDDVEIKPETMNIIWSIGTDDNLAPHSFENCGIVTLNLLPDFKGQRETCPGETKTKTQESDSDSDSESGPISPRTKMETSDSDFAPDPDTSATPTSTPTPTPAPDSSSVSLGSNVITILVLAVIVFAKSLY